MRWTFRDFCVAGAFRRRLFHPSFRPYPCFGGKTWGGVRPGFGGFRWWIRWDSVWPTCCSAFAVRRTCAFRCAMSSVTAATSAARVNQRLGHCAHIRKQPRFGEPLAESVPEVMPTQDIPMLAQGQPMLPLPKQAAAPSPKQATAPLPKPSPRAFPEGTDACTVESCLKFKEFRAHLRKRAGCGAHTGGRASSVVWPAHGSRPDQGPAPALMQAPVSVLTQAPAPAPTQAPSKFFGVPRQEIPMQAQGQPMPATPF